MANVHLGIVAASEFYEYDEDRGSLVRRIKSPKSLHPHLVVLTDDLYHAYTVGVSTTDYSFPIGQPGRNFHCKVILLFWTGDYPAQALVSGTHSKTCHWCRYMSVHSPEVSRQCWGDYRCFLPLNDLKRNHGGYGPPEDRPAPLTRTHAEFVTEGLRNELHQQNQGPKSKAPYKETGIKERSPLSVLPLFNLTWDVLGDMMHIIWGIWKRHIFEMLGGCRAPAKPKPRKAWSERANNKLARQHERVKEVLQAWTLSPEMKTVIYIYIYMYTCVA